MSFGDGGSLAIVILHEDLAEARYDRPWTDTSTGWPGCWQRLSARRPQRGGDDAADGTAASRSRQAACGAARHR